MTSPTFLKTKKKHPSNPLYQYHLEGLEDDCRNSYEEWTKKKEDPTTRYNLFIAMENLCYAVAQLTDIPTNHVNREEIAYEMSLWMLERIMRNDFVPVGTNENKRFPWQVYVRRCIPGFIPYPDSKGLGKITDFLTVHWENFTEKIEEEEDKEMLSVAGVMEEQPEMIYSKRYMQKKIVEALLFFYSEKELKRLYYMFCSLCAFSDGKYPARDPNMPQDIKEFSITVLVVAKRIAQKTNTNYTPPIRPEQLPEAIQSAIRSTMFLSAITERSSLFPKELVMSLDIDSLFRLCECAGGSIVRIPTPKELNSVIQAAATAAEMLTTGYEREDTTVFSQSSSSLPGSASISLTPLISKIIQHHSIFGDQTTQPSNTMHSILMQSIQGLDKLIDRIVATGISDSQVLYAYSELTYTVMSILKVLGQHVRSSDDTKNSTQELPGT